MNYTITSADPSSDRGAVLDLWNRNLPGADADRYDWLYGQSQASGWIARSRADEVVGGAGLMRRRIKVFDGIATAGQAIDLNVDRRHRAFGPAMALGKTVAGAVIADRCRMIYAFPNQQSEVVFQKTGYRLVGTLGRWAKPLTCEPFVRTRLAGSLPGRAALGAANVLLRCSSRESYTRTRGLRCAVHQQFDNRFDGLWERVSPALPIAGERTAEYLDWRFCRCRGIDHEVISVTTQDDELVAYVVFSRRGRYVYLDDFLGCDPKYVAVALAALLRQARREGAEAVVTVFLGSARYTRLLRQYGFWQRPSDWKFMVYGPQLQKTMDEAGILDPENWYLTRADLDTDF